MVDDDLPDTAAVADQLVLFLAKRPRGVRPIDVYDPLADIMKVTDRQRLLKRQTNDGSLWHNRVQTARARLVDMGWFNGRRRGFWSLTADGEARARWLDNPILSAASLGL